MDLTRLLFAELTLSGEQRREGPLRELQTSDGEVSFKLELQSRQDGYALVVCQCLRGGPVLVHIKFEDSERMTIAEEYFELRPRRFKLPTVQLRTATIAVYAIGGPRPPPGLRHSLNQARLEGDQCDAILEVDGGQLAAHRQVLAVRCPELERTLSVGEAGALGQLGRFSRRTMENFLEFLYTDRIQEWRDTETELLHVADRYSMQDLANECTVRLWTCSPLQAVVVLHAAGHSQLIGRQLRRRLTAVVLRNMDAVASSREWLAFQAAFPIVADSMLGAARVADDELQPRFVPPVAGTTTGVRFCFNLARLQDNMCDVTMVADGSAELTAHRLLLALRSPVLRDMLYNEDRIELVGYSRDAVDKFLEFLYTDGITTSLRNNEIKLLRLADRFEVPDLRHKCEAMLRNCSRDDALDVLHAAGMDAILGRRLRRHLTEKLVFHMNQLTTTSEWSEFEAAFPIVADSMRATQDISSPAPDSFVFTLL